MADEKKTPTPPLPVPREEISNVTAPKGIVGHALTRFGARRETKTLTELTERMQAVEAHAKATEAAADAQVRRDQAVDKLLDINNILEDDQQQRDFDREQNKLERKHQAQIAAAKREAELEEQRLQAIKAKAMREHHEETTDLWKLRMKDNFDRDSQLDAQEYEKRMGTTAPAQSTDDTDFQDQIALMRDQAHKFQEQGNRAAEEAILVTIARLQQQQAEKKKQPG